MSLELPSPLTCRPSYTTYAIKLAGWQGSRRPPPFSLDDIRSRDVFQIVLPTKALCRQKSWLASDLTGDCQRADFSDGP